MITTEFVCKKCEYEHGCSFKYDRQGAVDYAHYYTEGQGRRRGRYIRYISGAADSFLSWANPEYFFYKQNCAAFLSQCLHSGGGIPMDEKWYQRRIFTRRSRKSRSGAEKRRVLSLLLIIIQRLRLLLRRERWEVSEPWREAAENFKYFSDPSSGFVAGKCVHFDSAADIPRVITQSGIRPGDIIYLIKDGRISHCLLVSKLSENEIYYCANRYTRYDMELSEGLQRQEHTEALLLCLRDEMKPQASGDINE